MLVKKTFEIRYSHNQLFFFGGGAQYPPPLPLNPVSSCMRVGMGVFFYNFALAEQWQNITVNG